MDMHEGFEKTGFLCEGITNSIGSLRAENAEWFNLAEDTNAALVRLATGSMKVVKTNAMAREAIAARVLLRACANLQGAILLIERGMVAEARTLARSLIESAFCIAALVSEPEKFIQMLKDDSEASRRLQGKFIVAQDLVASGAAKGRLQAAISALDKVEIMSSKKVAALGPLMKQYLAYQRLSDDAAHVSARSLNRHVDRVLIAPDRPSWRYRWGAGDQGENAATLHHAILAALPVGVGVSQMLKDTAANAEFGDLANRFGAMPSVTVI